MILQRVTRQLVRACQLHSCSSAALSQGHAEQAAPWAQLLRSQTHSRSAATLLLRSAACQGAIQRWAPAFTASHSAGYASDATKAGDEGLQAGGQAAGSNSNEHQGRLRVAIAFFCWLPPVTAAALCHVWLQPTDTSCRHHSPSSLSSRHWLSSLCVCQYVP